MFWKKKDNTEKLAVPRDIPEFTQKYLVSENKIDANTLRFLKAVLKARANEDKVMDIRIFDPSDAEARDIKVANYDVLTQNSNMIIGEGWIDQANKKVDIAIKNKYEMPKLHTEAEILQQIESLQTPGSSVFFFMAAGTGAGGPLGRGASVIKLNDNKDEKKKQKYLIYGVSIVDGKPRDEGSFTYGSNKAKDVAKWVVDGHRARFC